MSNQFIKSVYFYHPEHQRFQGFAIVDADEKDISVFGWPATLIAPPVDNPELDCWRFDGTAWHACEPPPAPVVVPRSVSMRQARLALLAAGHLNRIEAVIERMPEPHKSASKIEWEYAAKVERHSDFVVQMGQALGMDDAQLDALFVAAAQW